MAEPSETRILFGKFSMYADTLSYLDLSLMKDISKLTVLSLDARAAIDVWYNYDPDPDEKGRKYPFSFPFHTLKNVILSPHRAVLPLDDLRRWNEVTDNIRRFAVGNIQSINVVDLEEEY